ncbi:hypothetical protein HQ520_00350, partial [bacterium]|nr:hypothetical protein [bacterium]
MSVDEKQTIQAAGENSGEQIADSSAQPQSDPAGLEQQTREEMETFDSLINDYLDIV